MNPLCKCECGLEVSGPNIKYISGHNTKGLKRDPSVSLKRKKTIIERYNVENISKLETIK